jgi:hypothetical protein
MRQQSFAAPRQVPCPTSRHEAGTVRTLITWGVFVAGLICSAQVIAEDRTTPNEEVRLDDKARTSFIRAAQIWSPTDIASLDLRAGPGGKGAFQPNETVTCDYVEGKLHGSNRKFGCAVGPDDVAKVRYGSHNREVHASVIATRLLWALGFGADRVYPVQVRCRGCSSDPWHHPERGKGEHLFAPAVIERRPAGQDVADDSGKTGWSWRELDLVDERFGGATVAQRDALKLLAAFMQHTDSKREQQRLLCLPGGLRADGQCAKPFLMLHDVGLTFGRANTFNSADTASVDLDKWATTPVWKEGEVCVAHLSKSATGTLENPRISEAGRRFLANLLMQLSDRQLQDLFEVAGVDRTAEWVDAFKRKRAEIVNAHCAP